MIYVNQAQPGLSRSFIVAVLGTYALELSKVFYKFFEKWLQMVLDERFMKVFIMKPFLILKRNSLHIMFLGWSSYSFFLGRVHKKDFLFIHCNKFWGIYNTVCSKINSGSSKYSIAVRMVIVRLRSRRILFGNLFGIILV